MNKIKKNTRLPYPGNRQRMKRNRPFWAPVVGYYFLSTALALTIFFIVWAILLETGDNASFIPAGIVAGLFMISAFVLREILLRRERINSIRAQERLDTQMTSFAATMEKPRVKLSLRKNEKLLGQIFEKSKAAKVLKHLPDAHWEAFELSDSYLRLTRKELALTHISSPRIDPITKSRGKIKKLHKSHLLKWAKLRSGMLMLKSRELGLTRKEREESSKMALITIETALDFYPREIDLQDSVGAIRDYIFSIKVSSSVEAAEDASKKGNIKLAIQIYEGVLVDLEKSELRANEKRLILDKVKSEILRLKG